jgi:hypothetical protein
VFSPTCVQYLRAFLVPEDSMTLANLSFEGMSQGSYCNFIVIKFDLYFTTSVLCNNIKN